MALVKEDSIVETKKKYVSTSSEIGRLDNLKTKINNQIKDLDNVLITYYSLDSLAVNAITEEVENLIINLKTTINKIDESINIIKGITDRYNNREV